MWLSGQSIPEPCAVERDALGGWVSNKRIISNNSYAPYDQGDNPGQEKERSTVSSTNCDRC